jgi:hypothetical protein
MCSITFYKGIIIKRANNIKVKESFKNSQYFLLKKVFNKNLLGFLKLHSLTWIILNVIISSFLDWIIRHNFRGYSRYKQFWCT